MQITMHKMLFIMASLVMFLSACSTTPVSQRPAVESRDLPPSTESAQTSPVPGQQANPQAIPQPPSKSTGTDIPATKPAPAPTNPAVLALLSDAEKYKQQGNMSAVQSRLQRAQRIAPSDPKVYYQLAQAHYELEDYRLAEQVALKGVSYARGDNKQQKRFWLLLAEIRQKSGNSAGEKAAREQAARY